jgi:hypothetical protein
MEQKPALKLSEETIEYEDAWRYGKYFYRATLADGRDVGFSADKVLVTDTGDMLAMSTSFARDREDGTGRFDREDTEPRTILCLKKDQWVCFYAASALTGDPVGIDWVEGYNYKKS